MTAGESVFDTIEPVQGVKKPKLKKKFYEEELAHLQEELVKLQSYIKAEGLKVVVIFEGRDAAGKGGAIRRITEKLSPRVCRVEALGTPTEREKTQWWFQRYVNYLPAAGEMVLFDRSWYNRALVEPVMGFCTEDEYKEFLRSCPEFERMLVRSGIVLIKYWFSVSDDEQEPVADDGTSVPALFLQGHDLFHGKAQIGLPAQQAKAQHTAKQHINHRRFHLEETFVIQPDRQTAKHDHQHKCHNLHLRQLPGDPVDREHGRGKDRNKDRRDHDEPGIFRPRDHEHFVAQPQIQHEKRQHRPEFQTEFHPR